MSKNDDYKEHARRKIEEQKWRVACIELRAKKELEILDRMEYDFANIFE